MIKTRKIRGHRKKWKDIESWVEANKVLDLEYLQYRQREYVKIWVHPWSGISIIDSEIAEPRGATRRRMLQGLIDIHDHWQKQLEALGQPYYLRIWLHDPQFSRSQVVCAIGSALDFYDITFHKPKESRTLNTANFGPLAEQMNEFDWEYRWNEFHFGEDELGDPEEYASLKDYYARRKWLNRVIKSSARKSSYENTEGETVQVFSHREGTVWLGKKIKP
jgi:uncharacterized protein (DUF736 family)